MAGQNVCTRVCFGSASHPCHQTLSTASPSSLRKGTTTCGLALAFCSLSVLWVPRLAMPAKLGAWASTSIMLVAVLVAAAGFAELDDVCPVGTFEGQCGLVCEENSMDFFTLCSPCKADAALVLGASAVAILIVATFVGTCVKLPGDDGDEPSASKYCDDDGPDADERKGSTSSFVLPDLHASSVL
eukprot:m.13906 g.13906  ORF g.13906 m.13906 type:complete len:186 (-) comp4687_c0_seq1:77-634(-)